MKEFLLEAVIWLYTVVTLGCNLGLWNDKEGDYDDDEEDSKEVIIYGDNDEDEIDIPLDPRDEDS